jgi:anionic cell wall polymer biosynthesis LytR-Cps2A-Psr (LCP) family protein
VKAAGLSEDSIETYTVPGDGKYIGDVSYFIQDEEGTEEMLLEVYGMTSSDDNAEDDENE